MTTEFQDISIRGRFAYGMVCLERLVSISNSDNELLINLVIPKLWEFTNTQRLDIWEESINEVDPIIVLESTNNSELKELYTNRLSKEIVAMISSIIDIGVANIYGSTKDHSSTLKPLGSVIKTMRSLNIPLPDIRPFKKSSFQEYHGWGDDHTREYYLS